MHIHRLAVVAQRAVYHREVQFQHQVGVPFLGGVLAHIEVAEQLLELVCPVDVVVMLQHGERQALAETARTDEEEELVGSLQFRDKVGLVHKIAVFADTGKIGHPVGDTLALNSVYFHTHRALLRKVTKNVEITNRNQHICILKVEFAYSFILKIKI